MDKYKRIKQVIIINHRLGMSLGKCCAQAAHSSQMAVLHMVFPQLNQYYKDKDEINKLCTISEDSEKEINSLNWTIIENWTKTGYAKIILRGEDEEQLISAYTRAKDRGIPCYLVLDEARTELNGKHYTAVAIGPYYADDIDNITGNFKLL